MRNPGRLVRLQDGREGRTKNSDTPINGKIPVYLNDGTKVLKNPSDLTVFGFID